MKRILLSTLAVLAFTSTAMADPIDLPDDTPLFFQFVNFEQVDTTLTNSIDVPGVTEDGAGSGNWGVFIITNIQTGTVSVPNQDIQGGGINDIYSASVGGPQIYGIFYDIDLTSTQNAEGGILELYWSDGQSVGNINDAAPDAATVTAYRSGTPLATLNFASGIQGPGDCTTTVRSTVDISNFTGTGQADSFANVNTGAGGAWSDELNGDWFNSPCGTRDIRFSNFFNLVGAPWDSDGDGPIIGLRSNDPGRVFTAAVPEPTSLTLLGLGLLGVARAYRRRNKA